MSILQEFRDIPEVVFDVFEELIIPSNHIIPAKKTGWSDDVTESVVTELDIIPASFKKEEIDDLSFRNEVQPTDVIVMIKGNEVASKGVIFRSSHSFELFENGRDNEPETFSVIASDTDPAKALYLVLLRRI